MTEEVSKLASLSLQSPVKLSADPKATAPHQLVQEVVRIKVSDLCKISNQNKRTSIESSSAFEI